MVAGDAPAEAAVGPEWIACGGSVRPVVDGIVVCPDGIFSPWAHCIGCRFLAGAEGDRDPERGCSVMPAAAAAAAVTAVTNQPESLVGWGELIIELL